MDGSNAKIIKNKSFINVTGDGLQLGGPYDGLGYDDDKNSIYKPNNTSGKYVVSNCLFDNSGVDPDDADEAISVIGGAKVKLEYSYVKNGGKALLLGNGDEPDHIAKENYVEIDHCIFEGNSRRNPYIQGAKVVMTNCLIKNGGSTFYVKSFGARVDREGSLTLKNCVFGQDSFMPNGLGAFFKDCINQPTGFKHIFDIFKPGVTRGLYTENGGEIEDSENLYKNKWWISLGGRKSDGSKDDAKNLINVVYSTVGPH